MIEPPEAPHDAGHKPSGIRWFDVLMAVGVLLLSAGSLYVALHTGHTMEKLVEQNARLVQAQSTPVLQYEHGNLTDEGERALYFDVMNVGTGPARVVWIKLMHEGRTFRDWRDLVQSLDTSGGDEIVLATAFIAQTMLSAGEERRVLRWTLPETPGAFAQWERLNQVRFDTTVEACYCSVFEQCWVSNLQADIPREVVSCENPDALPPEADH
jgi:hypothetical protein